MDLLISIENQLNVQTKNLIVIEGYIEYLKQLNVLNRNEILKRPYITVITEMVKCELVISLSVLCDYKSDYSFSKLRDKEVSLGDRGMSKKDRDQSCKLINEITEIYKGLRLKYIRDKYCAHLDKNRKDVKLDILKINELYDKMCLIYNFYSKHLFEKPFLFGINRNVLTDLLDDNKLLKKYISEERTKKRK